ncbi:MAG: hypothetical protein ACYSR0_12350 [Planctomycetota bacterium]|jgi:hypothetical protein
MKRIKRRKRKGGIKRRDSGIIRRRKFRRSKRKIILEALKAGLSLTRAIGLADVNMSTYREWMEKGKNKKRPTYKHFRNQVKRIEANIEREALNVIKNAYKGGDEIYETKYVIRPKGTEITKVTKTVAPSWQAAAWRLERKFFEEYGRNKDLTDLGSRSPEELARDVKAAADLLFGTVPVGKRVKPDDIPQDMPD